MSDAPRSAFTWKEYLHFLEIGRAAAAAQMPRGIVEGVSPEDIASEAVRVFEEKTRRGNHDNGTGILYAIVRNYVLQLRKKAARRAALVSKARPHFAQWTELFDSETSSERLFALYASLIEDDACFLAHYIRNNSFSPTEWTRARKDMGWETVRYEEAVAGMESLSEAVEHGDASYQVNAPFQPFTWARIWPTREPEIVRDINELLASSEPGVPWQYRVWWRIYTILQAIRRKGPLRISATATSHTNWLSTAIRLAHSINHIPALLECNALRVVSSRSRVVPEDLFNESIDTCTGGLLTHSELDVGSELGDLIRDCFTYYPHHDQNELRGLLEKVERMHIPEDAKARIRPIFQH